MQKCSFTLNWEGEWFSFNSEWELDSFLYEKLGGLSDAEFKKIKSKVIFSSDPKVSTIEKIKKLQEEVEKKLQEREGKNKSIYSVITSEDGEGFIETSYNLKHSTGVSTFIKSTLVNGSATTEFDEEGLFSIIGVSDKPAIKSALNSDWDKIRNYGIDFHSVLETLGSGEEGAYDKA